MIWAAVIDHPDLGGVVLDDKWAGREQVILEALVGYFDDPAHTRLNGISAVAELVPLDEDQVRRGMAALADAEPPYFNTTGSMGARVNVIWGVTERARREVGLWPNPESMTDRLVDMLNKAADREPDVEKKSFLRGLAGQTGGVMRDLTVDLMAAYLARQSGIGG